MLIKRQRQPNQQKIFNPFLGPTRPRAKRSKMVEATMKCYFIDQHQTVFPSIPVSNLSTDPDTVDWRISLGTEDANGQFSQFKVPQEAPISRVPGHYQYGAMCYCPMWSGNYLVLVLDQSKGKETWNLTPCSEHLILASGVCTHGDNYPENSGKEYLLSLCPGDWFGITINREEWKKPKVFLVHAYISSILLIPSHEKSDWLNNWDSVRGRWRIEDN